MADYKLILSNPLRPTIGLYLETERSRQSYLAGRSGESIFFYAEESYFLHLENYSGNRITAAELKINGIPADLDYDAGTGKFFYTGLGMHGWSGKIFYNYFGYVQLELVLTLADRSRAQLLYSPFVPILLPQGETAAALKRMAAFVEREERNFLKTNRLFSKVDLNRQEQEEMDLLQNAAKLFTKAVDGLEKGTRGTVRGRERLLDYQQIRKLSSQMLAEIARHPDELQRTMTGGGIQLRGGSFLPRKVLAEKEEHGGYPEETGILIGFLKTLCSYTEQKAMPLEEWSGPESADAPVEGFQSASDLLGRRGLSEDGEAQQDIGRSARLLHSCLLRLKRCTRMDMPPLRALPPRTGYFSTDPLWRKLYACMILWFSRKPPETEDRQGVALLQASRLYEYYVLLKLNSYLIAKGYTCTSAKRYAYPSVGEGEDGAAYTEAGENTFRFAKQGAPSVTVFYEPRIYGGEYEDANQTGLFRNTSLRVRSEYTNRPQCMYYEPDIVVRITDRGSSRYVILDAKFARESEIRRTYFSQLVMKYLFSLSTIDPRDKIAGLFAVSGKAEGKADGAESVYDYASERLRTVPVEPYAGVITLTEQEKGKSKALDKVFAPLLTAKTSQT